MIRTTKLRAFWNQRRFPAVRMGNERGIALILALVMLALLAMLGAWALNSSSTELRIAGNATNATYAFYCGDGGTDVSKNPDVLKSAHIAANMGTAPQTLPAVQLGMCSFQATVEFLVRGFLPKGSADDSDVTLDSSNTGLSKVYGLYFSVTTLGTATAGNNSTTLAPIQANVVIPETGGN